MKDDEKAERVQDNQADDEAEERLDDLEPAEDDNATVKGGGPRNQTASTGGKPTD